MAGSTAGGAGSSDSDVQEGGKARAAAWDGGMARRTSSRFLTSKNLGMPSGIATRG